MMNKKGITFTRLLLYILFCLVLVGIIYIFITTYKALKNNQKTQVNDSSLRFAYNNQYQYSAADSIIGIVPTFSNNNNFAGNVPSNPFKVSELYYPSTSDTYYSTYTYPFADVDLITFNMSTQYSLRASKSDNIVNVGNSLTTIGEYVLSYDETLSNGVHINSSTAINSLFMYYQLSCPISQFKGSFSGNDVNSRIRIFYVTDLDVDYMGRPTNYHYFTLANSYSFNLANELPGSLASASRVLYFGFVVYVNSNPSFYYTLLSSSGTSSTRICKKDAFLNKVYDSTFDVLLTFDILSGDNSYQEGYDSGYTAGRNDADDTLINSNYDLQTQVNLLTIQVDDLMNQVAQQSAIIISLNESLNNGSNFKNLFFTLADIPFATVHNALGFEFWGVNLFRFFTGVLTALGIIWLIKKIL